MRRTVLLYGVVLALLVFALKFFEYKIFVRDLSLEFYMGSIAIVFTTLGVWAGLRLTQRKRVISPGTTSFDLQILDKYGISQREYEVLELIALGLSNQEIADKLFVSPNTVKTHTSNLFVKLEARRRTEAVQKAKELGIIA